MMEYACFDMRTTRRRWVHMTKSLDFLCLLMWRRSCCGPPVPLAGIAGGTWPQLRDWLGEGSSLSVGARAACVIRKEESII